MTANKPILYGTYTSPGVNAVIMTLKAVNVDFEFREIKPLKNENFSEEYLKKNPTGTIPCLETEDHKFIGDSHAITAYVVDRYAADDSLYPKDLCKRAKVQQLQHFADSILFTTCVRPAYEPIFWRTKNSVDNEIFKRIDKAYGTMERFLSQGKWVAGDQLTIADFHCVVCVFGLFYLRPVDDAAYPCLFDWLQRMMAIPYVMDMLTSSAMTSSMGFLDKQIAKL
ncbi:glutathione S-transferase 1-like [Musca vetustissima]|uniref:glutathione S-transferase 1-like n=1 Tax=Musca vetustissima TaxID=27455 RepID=UPI002AB7CA4A|nr:glutathione S-transferase 1-like [Musca vetustissima]